MKKKLLLIPCATLLFCASFSQIRSTSAIEIKAEGEETSIVAEETSVVSEDTSAPIEETSSTASELTPEETESLIDDASQWIQDKIIPIIGSFSIATLISIIVSIATALWKKHGDKVIGELISNQGGKIQNFEKVISELKSQSSEQKQFYETTFDELNKMLQDTSITMDKVSELAKETAELIAKQNGKIEEVEKMKTAIEVSCNLVAKSLSLSQEAVKSGIAEDAQKLVDTMKGGE